MNEVMELNEDMRAPMTMRAMLGQVQTIQHVMREVMVEGVHYGKIPGTQSNTLFKAGAETLAAAFRIATRYDIEDLSASSDEVRLRVKCVGVHQLTGIELGQGMGEAWSNEEKYKWKRAGTRKEFEATPPDRRRIKYGYSKADRKEFEMQQVRAEAADVSNTILKMACKRAEVAMILTVLAAGDIFSQDLVDTPEELREREADSPPPAREVRQPEASKANVDKDTGEVRPASTRTMTATQINLLEPKMKEFDVGLSEIEKRFGAPLDKLPMTMFNEVQSFVMGETKPA